MIYSVNNNEPLVLVEADADSFLESVGVKLYEDEISINGTLYEGSYGESILAENGIFLYEDGIVLEGKQAEEYKARKAKAKEENIHKEDERAARRSDQNVGYKTKRYDAITGERTNDNFMAGYKKQDEGKMKKDYKNRDKAAKAFSREIERRSKDASGKVRKIETDEDGLMTDRSYWDFTKAADATMRHVRRHPKQYKESTIFSDIEII